MTSVDLIVLVFIVVYLALLGVGLYAFMVYDENTRPR